jgi:hypothetical protein
MKSGFDLRFSHSGRATNSPDGWASRRLPIVDFHQANL